jgi:hypothetical protein
MNTNNRSNIIIQFSAHWYRCSRLSGLSYFNLNSNDIANKRKHRRILLAGLLLTYSAIIMAMTPESHTVEAEAARLIGGTTLS